MAWYIGQSLPMMAIAFLVGLLVGYLLWGRRYRRLEQAEAVRAVDPATVLPHRGSAASSATARAAAPAAGAEAEQEPAAASTSDPADDAADDELAAGAEADAAEATEADAADAVDDSADHGGDEAGDETTGAAAEGTTDDSAEHEAVAGEADDAPVGTDASPAARAEDAHELPAAAAGVEPAEEADDDGAEPPTAAEIAALAGTGTGHDAGHDAGEDEPQSLFAAAGQPEPAAVAAPVTSSDRLERIEGIGPKIALALRTAGIRTFEELAQADESTLRDALADANLRFAPSLSTWARQARLLADGDHEGHAALTEQLVAGRAPKAQ